MSEWTFRLDLAGVDVDNDDQLDALFEAGCDDATFANDGGGTYAVFHRNAPSPESAVLSAIRDLEGVGAPVRVLRVDPEDDWLTAAEIAERVGRSRQSVAQLIRGLRGPGGFPAPVARRGARNPLWSWEQAREWFARYTPQVSPAQAAHPSSDFLAAVNDRLDLRERHRRAPDAPWWAEMTDVLPLVS
jgi:hypothetical protein